MRGLVVPGVMILLLQVVQLLFQLGRESFGSLQILLHLFQMLCVEGRVSASAVKIGPEVCDAFWQIVDIAASPVQ